MTARSAPRGWRPTPTPSGQGGQHQARLPRRRARLVRLVRQPRAALPARPRRRGGGAEAASWLSTPSSCAAPPFAPLHFIAGLPVPSASGPRGRHPGRHPSRRRCRRTAGQEARRHRRHPAPESWPASPTTWPGCATALCAVAAAASPWPSRTGATELCPVRARCSGASLFHRRGTSRAKASAPPRGRHQGDRCRHRGADRQDPCRRTWLRSRRGWRPQSQARRAHHRHGSRRSPDPTEAVQLTRATRCSTNTSNSVTRSMATRSTGCCSRVALARFREKLLRSQDRMHRHGFNTSRSSSLETMTSAAAASANSRYLLSFASRQS